jgi:hypothetical protein
MHYHSIAVIELVEGWNPIYVMLPGVQKIVQLESFAAKGAWYLSASIVKMTGMINTGKAYNFIIACAALFMGIFTLCYNTHGKKRILNFFLCLLIVLNPVLIYQAFSYYLDAYMGNLWLIFFFAMLLIQRKINSLFSWRSFIVIISVIAIICNIKFTGMFFAFIFYFFYWLLLSWSQIKNKEFSIVFHNMVPGLIGLALAFIIGMNPYITNLMIGENMFFPMLGDGRIELMGENVPIQIREFPGIIKLFYTIFSGENGILKIPFKPELYSINYDQRLGGFGPFFSGIFLVSIFLFGSALYAFKRKVLNKEGIQYLFICFVILVVALIFPESWWPRYYPILWAFPMFSILCLTEMYNEPFRIEPYLGGGGITNKKHFLNIIIISFCLFICVNIVYVFLLTKPLYIRTKNLNNALQRVYNQKVITYCEEDHFFGKTYRRLFKELGVEIIISDEPLQNPIFSYTFQFDIIPSH